MPRNGSGVASPPPGTTAAPNTTIKSDKYNAQVADVYQLLNDPTPVTAGGTGGATAQDAVDNLFDGTSVADSFVTKSLNGGPLAGFRNKIVNGSFRINQRGFVGGAVPADTYTLDRWKAGSGGGTHSVSGGVVTISSGTFVQVIDGFNIEVADDYTLSWVGTATATVNGTPIDNGGSVSLAAAAGPTISFSGGTVTKVQFERGEEATIYEERHISVELQMCQYYYQKVQGRLDGALGNANFGSVGVAFSPMRGTPTQIGTTFGATGVATSPSFGVSTPSFGVLSCLASSAGGFSLSVSTSLEAEL